MGNIMLSILDITLALDNAGFKGNEPLIEKLRFVCYAYGKNSFFMYNSNIKFLRGDVNII